MCLCGLHALIRWVRLCIPAAAESGATASWLGSHAKAPPKVWRNETGRRERSQVSWIQANTHVTDICTCSLRINRPVCEQLLPYLSFKYLLHVVVLEIFHEFNFCSLLGDYKFFWQRNSQIMLFVSLKCLPVVIKLHKLSPKFLLS